MTTPSAPGYSGTPLARKLGYKAAMQVVLIDVPANYAALVEPLPEGVVFGRTVTSRTELVHLFVTGRDELDKHLQTLRRKLKPEAVVWVSWPKRAAKVATDVTEDIVRELALPLGLVDIKVCAVSDIWSGLKLVVRKELR